MEDELEELNQRKRQEYTDSDTDEFDDEIEEVKQQIRDEAEAAGFSRRDFMKLVGGGAAGLGAAAMLPSLGSAFKVESDNALKYFNQSGTGTPSFEVTPSGNLTTQQIGTSSDKIQDIHASSISTKDLSTVTQDADYYVYKDGGTFYAIGQDDFPNKSASDLGIVINSAIDEVTGNPGGHIHITRGNYTGISTKIKLKNRVGLSGDGIWQTRLELASGVDKNLVEASPTADTSAMFIRDMMLNGNGANNTSGHVLHFTDANGGEPDDSWFDRVWFAKGAQDNVRIDTGHLLFFNNCVSANPGRYGLYTNDTKTIINGWYHFGSSGTAAIYADGTGAQPNGSDGYIHGVIQNPNNDGVVIDNSAKEWTGHVWVTSAGQDGLRISGPTNTFFVHSTGAGRYGIYVEGGGHNTVYGLSRNAGNWDVNLSSSANYSHINVKHENIVLGGTIEGAVVNGTVQGPETVDMGGTNGKISPRRLPAEVIPVKLDGDSTTAAATVTCTGVDNIFRMTHRVRLIHTGDDTITLQDVSNSGVSGRGFKNKGGTDNTLDANHEMYEYVYNDDEEHWREAWSNVA